VKVRYHDHVLSFEVLARIIVGVKTLWICLAALWMGGSFGRAASGAEPGTDWPQFLGPSRNGIYAGKDLAATWPAGGPKVLWQHKLGAGWSGPVVAGGKVVLFHRMGNKETVECLEAITGNPVWKGEYETQYRDDFGFDEGPRSTPAIDGGRVYTFGADGILSCWEMADGKRVWFVDTKIDLKADKGFFGIVCSPLIEGDAVILNVGGQGAGIVAFDKANGKVLWKATEAEAGYSSPVSANFGGKRYVLSLTRAGLAAIEPKAGKILFEYPFRSKNHASVNAATPVVVEDSVFLSASYGTGAALLKFDESGPKEVWANDESLSAHYATPVYRDGYLYGFDGRQEQGCNFRCIEMKSGKVKWSEDRFGAGTVTLTGDELLILSEKGELVRALASPDGFKVKDRAQILGHEVRAYAALAGGLYFARDKAKVVCVDLRK
jgi:outer membrane protein assembly factor BamB